MQLCSQGCDFLGHSLSSAAITISLGHVEALRTYPPPTTIKEVHKFVGLVQFFNDYIPQRPNLTAPLTALTKQNAVYSWSDECQENFDKMKEILTQRPVSILTIHIGSMARVLAQLKSCAIGMTSQESSNPLHLLDEPPTYMKRMPQQFARCPSRC